MFPRTGCVHVCGCLWRVPGIGGLKPPTLSYFCGAGLEYDVPITPLFLSPYGASGLHPPLLVSEATRRAPAHLSGPTEQHNDHGLARAPTASVYLYICVT